MHRPIPRFAVVACCFALSGFGSLMALVGLADVGPLAGGLVLLLWLAAITSLVRMSLAWVQDTRLGPRYSARAFLMGVASLLAIPVSGTFQSASVDSVGKAAQLLGGVLLFEIVLVLPAIVLASYLNYFHSRSTENARGAYA